MKKPDPVLRELGPSSSFSVPHAQCRVGALFFLNILEEETARVRMAADNEGGTPEVLDRIAAETALERQALSEAVQVFAAMALESAVNLLGVLALGEEQFLRELERRPLLEKLSTLLKVIEGKSPSESDEMLVVAGRLADARNAFVHPKPQEGPLRHVARERRSDLSSAQAAIDDMEHFLGLLRKRNYRYSIFFTRF
ncbi:MAG: hypothetical protein JWL97_826 [Gemmatimonadales bacterium]|jgi:hypothetical protein|nr:hypothetical protein [Gemmatimonadales bacterium]